MQHVTFDEGKEICLNHRCGQCDSILVLAWDGQANAYAVRCGKDRAHEGFKRIPTLFEARATGGPLPMELEQVFQRKEERQMKEVGKSTEPALMTLVPREDSADGKALSPAARQSIIDYAKMLDLNPYLQHVDIYQGRLRVTIYGRYYDAKRHPEYKYVRSRPLTTNERGDQQIAEGVLAWFAEVVGANGDVLSQGFGYASLDNLVQLQKGVPEKWGTPQRRAEKRAEEDALAKAFPIGGILIDEEEVSDDLPSVSE